jgi:hypothetical protein
MSTKRELTKKENMELVLAGKQPEWIPSFFVDCAFTSSVALGRRPDPKTGHLIDIFGTVFANTIDGMVPLNTHTREFNLTDIKKWRDIMPDIDRYNIGEVQ